MIPEEKKANNVDHYVRGLEKGQEILQSKLKEIRDKMKKYPTVDDFDYKQGYNDAIDEIIEILNQYIKDGE